ncbi:hypothetical protein VAS14_00256 [Vibrio angustum S14]|uniref:Uncharacterized protein n=1 Tax=Photobacterium angustum (strain S14 / CCUG 15956) TaxID=314292 RepID=Q1ZJR8_PHOAS|nr:hypothetical protein [Photobacterium angustum]EAS62454.1 hypothetical protein VAS14_00256 [Vibrio angustum S14] [Photobacterium angustum S14]
MGKYSTASDLGEAAKCPHGLYLQKNKASVTSDSTQWVRNAGEKDHQRINNIALNEQYETKRNKNAWLYILLLICILGVIWIF